MNYSYDHVCDCKEWDDGMRQIDAAQFMAFNKGCKYTATPFRFCPWCGKQIGERRKCDGVHHVIDIKIDPAGHCLDCGEKAI